MMSGILARISLIEIENGITQRMFLIAMIALGMGAFRETDHLLVRILVVRVVTVIIFWISIMKEKLTLVKFHLKVVLEAIQMGGIRGQLEMTGM
uniref:Uncharacterized protein n=1 Tax=Picea sitchensis TaxID=3332 RepID=A9NJY1_PICSI|nr:unknown [Picea sitchensis]